MRNHLLVAGSFLLLPLIACDGSSASSPATTGGLGTSSGASGGDGGAGGGSSGAGVGGGDGGAGPTDPCVGVTCSGHGTCAVVSGAAACTCESGYHASGLACVQDGGLFGMNVPSGHPRLLFNSQNLAAAKAWYAAHPFDPNEPLELALKGLLAGDGAACASAIASAKSDSAGMDMSGTACDNCRWNGETDLLVYDWCYDAMSASDRTALEGSIDQWVDHWRTQSWGGPGMYENNYYWGYLRNEFEWGVLSAERDASFATTQLDDVFNVRLANDFYPAPGAVGGVGQEGAQYGPYQIGYAAIPLATAAQMGRAMFDESSFWLGAVYAYLYETTPNGQVFTWNDNDDDAPSDASPFVADYMTAAANYWSGAPVGQYAREWLTTFGVKPDLHFLAFDDGVATPKDFGTLPFDYFAAGPQYLFGRSSWTSPTAYMLSFGMEHGVGHNHVDYGAFQIWRGGKWLSRESVGYGNSGVDVVGLGGNGSSDVSGPVAHNTVGVGNALPEDEGDPVVTRLESQPGYAFASVDLSSTFKSATVVRDVLFVRSLETMVIFDRGANVFLAHCETAPAVSGSRATCTNGSQALVVSSLVGSPSISVVDEGGDSGQPRVEIRTAQNEMITVLQAKDANAPALAPTVVDDGASYTVTLSGKVSIQLAKGATSTGGSITIDGTTTPLRATVQPMAITASGPSWQ